MNVTSAANWSCTVVQTCSSQLQVVWISVIYAYKALIFAAGLYFTWNTRQVSEQGTMSKLSVIIMCDRYYW